MFFPAFLPRLALATLACATVWFATATPAPVGADARPVPVLAAAQAPTANCYGNTCTGLNPETLGCGADADTSHSTSSGGAVIENRYSTTCNAEWSRTINRAGAARYAAASARYGCATYCYHYSVSSPAPIANEEKVYTSMIGPDTTIDTLSCGKVATTGPLSTPVTSPCSIVN